MIASMSVSRQVADIGSRSTSTASVGNRSDSSPTDSDHPVDSQLCRMAIGSRVRVRENTRCPRYGWGCASRRSQGELVQHLPFGEVLVKFPGSEHLWHGLEEELESLGHASLCVQNSKSRHALHDSILSGIRSSKLLANAKTPLWTVSKELSKKLVKSLLRRSPALASRGTSACRMLP
eukprot:scpid95130/ scgid16572/ 